MNKALADRLTKDIYIEEAFRIVQDWMELKKGKKSLSFPFNNPYT